MWHDIDTLPKNNELVIVIDRWLNVHICVYKEFTDKHFGLMNLFIPVDDMRLFDNKYLDDSLDWYREHHNYDKCYISRWSLFPKDIK